MRFLSRLVVLLAVWLAMVVSTRAAEGFRRFHETISPDGSWVLGWGTTDVDSPKDLKEWPEAEERDVSFDFDDYLVDAKKAKPVKKIPEFHYFACEAGRENHAGLYTAWSPDSRSLLAIYDGRWASRDIVLIEPQTGVITHLHKPMEAAFRKLVISREKVRKAGEISFSHPVLLEGGILIADAWWQVPKEGPVFHYKVKLQLKVEGGKAQVTLVKSRRCGEDEPEDGSEENLNKIYQKLRAKLDATGREALKLEEQRWLKQREVIADELTSGTFTMMRVDALSARLEGW